MDESHGRDEMTGTIAGSIERANPALGVAGIDREGSLELLVPLRAQNAMLDRAHEDALEGGVRRALENVGHRVFEVFGDFGMICRAAIGRELRQFSTNLNRNFTAL